MAYNPGISYRGDMHLAQGMADAGAGIAQGVSQMNQNKETRKRYGQILEGMGKDPNEIAGMSLGEMGGMIKSQAMQFADQQQTAELEQMRMQNEQLEMQNRAYGEQMKQQQQARQSENQYMKQLSQFDQGVGVGVYKPEVMKRYTGDLQNPTVQRAVRSGMSLEQSSRFNVPEISAYDQARTGKTLAETQKLQREMEMGGEAGFSPGDMGQARPIPGVKDQFFVPTSKGGGQIISTRRPEERELRETRLFEAWSQAQESGNLEAAEFYSDVMDKIRGEEGLDPGTMRMLAISNPAMLKEILALQRRRGQPDDDKEKLKDSPPLDPAAAKKNVMGRLFGR